MRAQWQIKQVDYSKKVVREQLGMLASMHPDCARHEIIFAKIDELSKYQSSDKQLIQFIYIMWALIEHRNRPYLRPSQFRHLIDTGLALLKVNHIKPKNSSTSVLYNELYTVVSQIQLKEGQNWEAAWSLNLARSCHGNNLYSKAHDALSQGLRQLSINNVTTAIYYLESAAEESMDQADLEKTMIQLIRCYRLAKDYASARKVIDEYPFRSASDQFSKKFLLEFEWEKKILLCLNEKDFSPLLELCRREGSHCLGSYLLEANLWKYSTQDRSPFPKLRTVQQYPAINLSQDKNFYKIVMTIEDIHDDRKLNHARLEKIGQVFANIAHLSSPDKKLLSYYALSKQLFLNQAYSFYQICAHAYRSLSWTVTDGYSNDALGIGTLGERKNVF